MRNLKQLRLLLFFAVGTLILGCTQNDMESLDSSDAENLTGEGYYSSEASPNKQGGFGPGDTSSQQGGFGPGDSSSLPSGNAYYTWYRIDPVQGPMEFTLGLIWITSHQYCAENTVGTVVKLENLMAGPGLDRLVCAKSTEKHLAVSMIRAEPIVTYNGYFLSSTLLPSEVVCSPKMGQACNACMGNSCEEGLYVCSGGCGKRSALLKLGLYDAEVVFPKPRPPFVIPFRLLLASKIDRWHRNAGGSLVSNIPSNDSHRPFQLRHLFFDL